VPCLVQRPLHPPGSNNNITVQVITSSTTLLIFVTLMNIVLYFTHFNNCLISFFLCKTLHVFFKINKNRQTSKIGMLAVPPFKKYTFLAHEFHSYEIKKISCRKYISILSPSYHFAHVLYCTLELTPFHKK
jgi:hypothetical protein